MKHKKNRRSRTVLITILLVLAALTTVAVTWALSPAGEMGKRDNIFTPDDTVKLSIAEPWWDFLNENGKYNHTTGGVVTENTTEEGADVPSDYPLSDLGLTTAAQGEDMAARYLPDSLVPKNPKLYNMYTKTTGDDDNTGAEYVAMTLSYRLLIPTQFMSQSNLYTQQAGSNVTGNYWSAMSDFSAFNTYTDDNDTPADATDDKVYLSIDMTYPQFNALARVYKTKDDAGFNTGNTANTWTAIAGYPEGAAYYYNGVVYANGSSKLNATYTNPTAPLFRFVRINSFDGTSGQGSTLALPDADSESAASSVKYALTAPDKNGSSVTLYMNHLPEFEINLQGFAIDANVSEFKSGNAITDLGSLDGDAKTDALAALNALIEKANS